MSRALLLSALVLAGCASDEALVLGAVPAEDSLASPLVDGVSWGLDWDLGTAELTDGGWAITNDLGFTFVLEGGWLLDYSLTMVPCDDAVADAGWERFFGIRTAWAGNGDWDDPSEIMPQHPEALDAIGATTFEPLTFDAVAYCHVHWLIARGDEGTTAADGTDLSGVALQVAARWEGAETSGVLDITTEWTNGVLLDVGVPEDHAAASAPVHAEVTVVRSLDGLFDGIDPTVHTDLEIAWALLTNLVEQADVRFDVAAID